MKSSVVGHIVRSRFLEATAGHYLRMVERLEASGQLAEWLEQGVVIRHHLPYSPYENSSVVVACCDEQGAHLADRLFAVHYEWLELPAEHTSLVHNMEHISRRNRQLYRLLSLLADHQQQWFQSGKPGDLQRYPYKQAVGGYSQHWSGYMDISVVSRLVSGKRVALCFKDQVERIIPLRELFPRRWEQLGERIRQLMEDRERIWTDESLAEELTQWEGPISRRYVAHVRNRYGLSPGRGRRLKWMPGTPPICWGVPGPLRQNRFVRYRPVVVSMSYPERGGVST